MEEGKRSPWLIGYSLLLACLIGPVVEELFFRGFLYPAIRKKIGMEWAAFASALLFALIHENSFAFLPIFVLGIALCYLYEKRKSLIACMSFHILHNSAFLFYFFLMKKVLLTV
jgi:uncharacterized protein